MHRAHGRSVGRHPLARYKKYTPLSWAGHEGSVDILAVAIVAVVVEPALKRVVHWHEPIPYLLLR
jgi:hypothetical protein